MKRLTDDEVRYIHGSKEKPKKLIKKFGISRTTIRNIKLGLTRRHLGLGPTKKQAMLELAREAGLPPKKTPTEKAHEQDEFGQALARGEQHFQKLLGETHDQATP